MEIKSLEDILKAHQEFARRTAELAATLGDAESPGSFLSLQASEELLSQHQQQLDALIAARERAIRRYDTEIARHQQITAQLEEEIKVFKRTLAAQPAPRPVSSVRPAVKPPASTSKRSR